MLVDAIALSSDTMALLGDTMALSGDTIALSGDTIALSGDTIALQTDALTIQEIELRWHANTKCDSFTFCEKRQDNISVNSSHSHENIASLSDTLPCSLVFLNCRG
ncbi:hypothetical protein LC653_34535 [Nostoc sp. CHAB 5784]|uniref:hypothetical protein n=1 Tax=Nostoc mirabile TaxID=2907820 RepID=UPI001E59A578|nr:hypothetical protein [Nostoc mirabile]MCC5668837.1 hypothetical protein [Nostoc mirabile CHAB5784]